MTTPKQFEDLHSSYRAAFREWVSQLNRLDQIRGFASENGLLEDAQSRTATAEANYREIRNQLTEEMAQER